MDDSHKNISKSVHLSSLVDLKAELFRKQQSVKNHKLENPREPFRRDRTINKLLKTNIWNKKNQGVLERALSDLEQKEETDDSLEQSKKMLEKKSKLYDSYTQAAQLPDEDGSKKYLVDFQKKAIDRVMEERDRTRAAEREPSPQGAEEDVTKSGSEWVNYTDRLGRAKTCLIEDLQELQSRDNKQQPIKSGDTQREPIKSLSLSEPRPTLMSHDMERELQRQRWEQQMEEELNTPMKPLHYADVQHNEVRTHGVGFYQFSQDEEERQQQLKTLKDLRNEAISQQAKREKVKLKRKQALDARLAKVKARRLGKEIPVPNDPEEGELGVSVTGVDPTMDGPATAHHGKEELSVKESMETVRVREWDKGKTLQMFESIEEQKQRLEQERPAEFAPPTFYYEGRRRFNKKNRQKHPTRDQNLTVSSTTVGTTHADLSHIPLPYSKSETESSAESIGAFLHECRKATNWSNTGERYNNQSDCPKTTGGQLSTDVSTRTTSSTCSTPAVLEAIPVPDTIPSPESTGMRQQMSHNLPLPKSHLFVSSTLPMSVSKVTDVTEASAPNTAVLPVASAPNTAVLPVASAPNTAVLPPYQSNVLMYGKPEITKKNTNHQIQTRDATFIQTPKLSMISPASADIFAPHCGNLSYGSSSPATFYSEQKRDLAVSVNKHHNIGILSPPLNGTESRKVTPSLACPEPVISTASSPPEVARMNIASVPPPIILDIRNVQLQHPGFTVHEKRNTTKYRDMFSGLYGVTEEELSD